MSNVPRKLYIAGPFGFSEASRDFYYRRLIPELKRLGYQILDPWKLTDRRKIERASKMRFGQKRRNVWRRLNLEIGRNNMLAIDRCDGVLAILDGPDVDSGTASEIGYAFAKGKTVVGYRGDFRLSADNDGALVNLQVEYFIRQSGGGIIRTLKALSPALAKALRR